MQDKVVLYLQSAWYYTRLGLNTLAIALYSLPFIANCKEAVGELGIYVDPSYVYMKKNSAKTSEDYNVECKSMRSGAILQAVGIGLAELFNQVPNLFFGFKNGTSFLVVKSNDLATLASLKTRNPGGQSFWSLYPMNADNRMLCKVRYIYDPGHLPE